MQDLLLKGRARDLHEKQGYTYRRIAEVCHISYRCVQVLLRKKPHELRNITFYVPKSLLWKDDVVRQLYCNADFAAISTDREHATLEMPERKFERLLWQCNGGGIPSCIIFSEKELNLICETEHNPTTSRASTHQMSFDPKVRNRPPASEGIKFPCPDESGEKEGARHRPSEPNFVASSGAERGRRAERTGVPVETHDEPQKPRPCRRRAVMQDGVAPIEGQSSKPRDATRWMCEVETQPVLETELRKSVFFLTKS